MKKKSYFGVYFLLCVVALYIIIGFLNIAWASSSLIFSLKIFKNVVPILFLVFGLMAVVNYYLSPKLITQYFGESSGIKKWVIAIVGGIISTGPVYVWYPILGEFKKKGASYGFIATFIYCRAIKIPLIPILIFYFGWKYVCVLTGVMIVSSLMIGLLFDKLDTKLKYAERDEM